MIKYSRMQKEIPSWLVCGSHGTCLDCTLLRVQVTAGLGFYLLHKPQASLQIPVGIVKIESTSVTPHANTTQSTSVVDGDVISHVWLPTKA